MASLSTFFLIGFVIGIVIVIFSYGAYIQYADGETLNYIWVGDTENRFKVNYIISDQMVEILCMSQTQACHKIDKEGNHYIYYPNDPFRYTHPGCNIWTHEILHAWGYNEQMIRDFFDCRGSQFTTLPHIGSWR